MPQNTMRRYHTFSSSETSKLAERLVHALRRKTAYATVLALHGELGSGKTTFAQGCARALKIRRKITSPTFILMRRHALRGKRFSNLYHLDCYRIKKGGDARALDLPSLMRNPTNLLVVEWPERIIRKLPKDMVRVNFCHGVDENERIIEVRYRK